MTGPFRVDTATAPPEILALDLIDDFSLYETPGSLLTAAWYARRGVPGRDPAANFYTFTGGTPPAIFLLTGLPCYRYAPGLNNFGGCFGFPAMPVGRDQTLTPASLRTARLYVWQTVVQRTTPLVAGARFEIGLTDDGSNLDISQIGLVLRSDSTLNAGRWTVASRHESGDPTVIGVDTGVAPSGLQQAFELRYRESTSPQMEFFIDGALVATVAGLANLPVLSGGECVNISAVAGFAAQPAGQVDFLFNSRYFIQELEPLP